MFAVQMTAMVVMVVVRVIMVVIDRPRLLESTEVAVGPVVGVNVFEVAVPVQYAGARAAHE